MPFSRFPSQRGGLLVRHLGQLSGVLGTLSERTRHGVAQALAEAAADLVGDAVRAVLAVREDTVSTSRRPGRPATSSWDWADEADDRHPRDDFARAPWEEEP